MPRYTLPLALLGLMLLTTSCRHLPRLTPQPAPQQQTEQKAHYSHEEAEPVSNLPHEEFSKVTRGRR